METSKSSKTLYYHFEKKISYLENIAISDYLNPLAAAAVKRNGSFFAACFFLFMYFFAYDEISRF